MGVLLIFFVPFLLIVSIVLMNLVTAIIVEAFLEHAKQDQELRKKEHDRHARKLLPHLQDMFEKLDLDSSGLLTLHELMLAPDNVKEELAKCLDSDGLTELWEILDVNGDGQVDINEFCDGIVKLSLSNQPLDLMRIMKQIGFLREDMETLMGKLMPQKSARATRLLRASEQRRVTEESSLK